MSVKVFTLLRRTGHAVSNSEARRCLFGGAVFLNGNRIQVGEVQVSELEVDAKAGDVLKVGKRAVTLTDRHIQEE